MTFFRPAYILVLILTFGVFTANAQDSAIGYWESHLPYNTALGVATDGNILFTVCNQGFFTFKPDIAGKLPEAYSKAEGMSDMGMQCIGYDAATSTTILVYANGNIDLFKDNSFYNIPDLKIKSISGTKQVFQVYTENGQAYLSTSLGVLVVDLSSRTIKQTYQFINTATLNNEIIPVKSFTGTANYFYAATDHGLYRADKNSPQLQNFQVWKRTDSTHTLTNIAKVKNTLYFSTRESVYTLSADTLLLAYSATFPAKIQHIDEGYSSLFISEYNDTTYIGSVKLLNQSSNTIIESISWPGKPMQVVQRMDSSIWIADYFVGLEKKTGTTVSAYIPIGPADPNSFDIYANNKNLWIAHGGYTPSYAARNSSSGIVNMDNGKWTTYKQYLFRPLDTMQDFVVLLKDEKKGTLYAGSYLGGLFILNSDKTYSILKQSSIFEPSAAYNDKGQRQIVGLALDNSDNLWVTTFGSQHVLYAKSADSVWYKYTVPNSSNGGPVVTDDNGQVWFVCYLSGGNGGGVSAFDPAGTLGDPSDDNSYHLTKGVGAGNLPSNTVFCIAKDNRNNIWVGTDNGIAIIGNCSAPFTQSPPCDAEIPIVQYDNYAGYLFEGSAVRTIAVDGANRKWVGTDDGVWLLSPDASKIIYRFTVDNSPLPSNNIQKISVDKVTGDVYIGTEMGLICYRSTATEGGTSNENVLVFPNPVKNTYSGTIAIKGLAENVDVRITDISGQLVYKTTALGGQAVWNGLDYKGRRPQTGVYLIFASNSDGTQTYSGKIVFIQ